MRALRDALANSAPWKWNGKMSILTASSALSLTYFIFPFVKWPLATRFKYSMGYMESVFIERLGFLGRADRCRTGSLRHLERIAQVVANISDFRAKQIRFQHSLGELVQTYTSQGHQIFSITYRMSAHCRGFLHVQSLRGGRLATCGRRRILKCTARTGSGWPEIGYVQSTDSLLGHV